MKQFKPMLSVLSVLLAFCFVIGAVFPNQVISARADEYSDNYESLSAEEKQAYLEQQLKEVNSKLDDLARQSKDTEEYINTLDEKISYMNKQLTLSKEEMEASKNKISTLKRQYTENEKEIASLQVEIKELSKESEELKEKFDLSYVQYSQRAKAMYVSGNMTLLEALLTSDDISTLMTRIEMVRRVSKQDKELLDTLQTQGKKLDKAQKELSNKKDSLSNNQQALVTTQQTLTQTVKDLEKKQASFADMQSDYESEKKEADALLIKIQQDTQTYSEFRHQDQAELDAINREIEEAAEKYLQQIEEQNRTTTTTTTTTTKPHSSSEGGSSSGTTTTTKPTTTKTTTASSGKLKMTYPVPSQTKITTGYGSAGYAGHTGVDFACAPDSKVVAAESGTVIISKDLTNSDGSYRSYGRYIVIAHDKKNSSGNYVYTLYAHNSSRVVSEGQYVKKGQLIAYSGSTGNSTGPHCHFEVRTPTASYSDCVNPTNYLP